jgi:hypothetical protein
MQAERIFIETDEHGNIKNPPPLPPSARIEAILLVLEPKPTARRRGPTQELKDSIRIVGDIVAPATMIDEWDALK